VCEEVKAVRARLLAEAVTVMTGPATCALATLTTEYLGTLSSLKEQRGVLDFGDLQLHAANLLERRRICEIATARRFGSSWWTSSRTQTSSNCGSSEA
jgi:ATP-dependent exoDNAse (exonuclease V) beta subunit